MTKFYEGMSEIFEVDEKSISPEFNLRNADIPWDSLAIVSTIALVDECHGVMLDGLSLVACNTIGDVEALITKAQQE